MKKSKAEIYRTIKRKIINLELSPGDSLSDRKLAEELLVSRTPVREALHLLQTENYVAQKPGRGFFVKDLSLKEVEDMFTVREALEVCALQQAADNKKFRDLDKIQMMLVKHEEMIRTYEPRGKFLEDADFHRSLAAVSNNGFLLSLLESIFERIEILKNIQSVSLERVRVAHGQHMLIYGHIKKGDYGKAKKVLREHISDSKSDMLKRIRDRFEVLHYGFGATLDCSQNTKSKEGIR